jgi:CHAT domain-containing protein
MQVCEWPRRAAGLCLAIIAAVLLAWMPGVGFAQGEPDPDLGVEERASSEAIAAARKVLEQKLPEGATRDQEIRFLVQRERAAFAVGDGGIRLEALRRLVELHRGRPEEVHFLIGLWREEWRSGNQAQAFRLGDEILAMKTAPLGARAEASADMIFDYLTIGDMARAEAALRTAESLRDEHLKAGETRRGARVAAIVEYARANLLRVSARYTEAEVSIRRSHELIGQALQESGPRAKSETMTSPHEANLRVRNYIVGEYVRILAAMGRNVEAESMARQGLQDALADQTLGYTVGYWYGRIGVAKIAQRRYAEAQTVIDQGLDVLAKSGLSPTSERVLTLRIFRLQSLLGQQRWKEADAEYASQIADTANDAVARQLVSQPAMQAMLHALNGRWAQSLQVIEPTLRYRTRNWGETNPGTVDAKLVRAMALQAQGLTRIAISAYREAFRATFAEDAMRTDYETGGLRGFYFSIGLESFLRLVAEQAAAGEVDPEVAADAFVVADRLRDSALQRAIIDAAARTVVAGNPEIAALIRKEQDIRNARRENYGALAKVLAEIGEVDQKIKELKALPEKKPELKTVAEQRAVLVKTAEDMRAKTAALDEAQRAVRQDVAKRFPEYSRLVNPPPVRPGDVAKRLGPDEALVSIYSTQTETFVWAIRAGSDPLLRVSPLGEKAVDADVARLRATLELDSHAVPPPFDFDASHRLYAGLLQPVAKAWSGAKVVTFAVSGALGQIPFSILVKEPATRGAYDAAAWIVRDVAVAHVASASAWVAVRDSGRKSAAPKAFVGFGDPQFDVARAAPSQARAVRAVSSKGLPTRSVDRQEFDYGSIPPLPETRDEILAIAQSLGADPSSSTFFGKEASRERVMSMDLRDYRVVAFATHGLRPGELPQLSQPALALAGTGDAERSPLLVLDDVLKLTLGADWVVLSACNTAAGDGKGEEAISGLGRGFFFAGARSMLVTHWAVESTSARALVSRLFARHAEAKGASRAQSLREAQLEMIGGEAGKQFMHPAFWSPYALVGDAVK